MPNAYQSKVLGALVQHIGQPAVLGELVAGVILGRSVLGLVNSETDVLHLFAELGVIILLFEIGLVASGACSSSLCWW